MIICWVCLILLIVLSLTCIKIILESFSQKLSPTPNILVKPGPKYTVYDIFLAINQIRENLGLDKLTANKKLGAAATIKAQELMDCGCFQHTLPSGQEPWDLIQAASYSYLQAGEILAENYNYSNDIIEAWMNSPGHRDNIINPNFKEFGIGIVKGDKRVVVVVEFGDPVTTSTPEFIKLK